jgi:hypothetical protein
MCPYDGVRSGNAMRDCPTEECLGKYLKAAQALAQLHNADSNSSALHVRLVHFKKNSKGVLAFHESL